MKILDTKTKNEVLAKMAQLLIQHEEALLEANALDMASFDLSDLAMKDRLKVDRPKIQSMVDALVQLEAEPDPIGVERYRFKHELGMDVVNKTAAFGTVLIIYESRPDVTVEAAGIAFKSGNRILLKGGKESRNSNKTIVSLWHKALESQGLDQDWISYLDLDRKATQAYLKSESANIDLIIPRGGETLIQFVKEHARCPVVVSGRGNNFALVDKAADPKQALEIILNAKTDKISACNALDKVLIHESLPQRESFVEDLVSALQAKNVQVLADQEIRKLQPQLEGVDQEQWYAEYLDYKILIGSSASMDTAIGQINRYSGGHSATILSGDEERAQQFMEGVDSAAVYHNASTRFTDGFQFGLGGELAISTDKLHHRGPMGLGHLVTNKWYVYGNGQIR